ncbi:MAG TPA: glycosyltransferase [Bacteroidia bacterium]|jgi:biofilm PGA synthesis N-glycosyltransferase PgaC|nr:glycosyltransferase [Bacteroidia bacterium]
MPLPQFDHIGIEEILSILGSIILLIHIIHYFLNYWPVAVLKTNLSTPNTSTEPVSVIICARNEDENLTEFLPKILTQEYPEFEVIVVNDCSWDNTETVIDEFARIFPNLKKITIKEDENYKHGKKFAILVGIKGAKYENLVFIDADCYPASNTWLKEIASGFSSTKEIVLGYGAYIKAQGFLNKLIRFDTFTIALRYLSAGMKGKAYMGVGRNLAYKKSLFFKHKGFSSHYQINSGDDDLFVNEAATSENTNVLISHDSITYSKAKKTFRDWRMQKVRHLTTAPLYAPASRLKIGFDFSIIYLFYAVLVVLFCFKSTVLIGLGLFLLKIIFQMVIFRKASKKFNEPDLWAMAFVYEFVLLFIYPIFHVAKMLFKPNKWTN